MGGQRPAGRDDDGRGGAVSLTGDVQHASVWGDGERARAAAHEDAMPSPAGSDVDGDDIVRPGKSGVLSPSIATYSVRPLGVMASALGTAPALIGRLGRADGCPTIGVLHGDGRLADAA